MAPTLEEFRRLKKLKVEELRQCETDSRSIKHSSQDELADVRPAQRSPRRNEWYKRRNREKSTSKRDCDDMKSKNKGIFSRKKARSQRPDVVSDIIKGIEDNIVPNLQSAVTNKLVVPSLPLAKRTTFPIKKPTPANLKNAELIRKGVEDNIVPNLQSAVTNTLVVSSLPLAKRITSPIKKPTPANLKNAELIRKGVEDNIVPNLQAAVTNKLVVPSLPLAKRTTSPIKKPTPANLKNAELIRKGVEDNIVPNLQAAVTNKLVVPSLPLAKRTTSSIKKPVSDIIKGVEDNIVPNLQAAVTNKLVVPSLPLAKRTTSSIKKPVSDIRKGVEDNIVPNLQAAVTNKLVVPSLPLAKRTTSPIKKPTPANLKNAEIIDLMSSDDELDHATPLLSSIRRKGNTNKPLPSTEKGGNKHIVGKSSGGLKVNVSRAMSVMRAIDEVDSATNSEAEEDSPVRPVKGIVHEANIDTSTLDESISVEKDDAQENVESIEIDPNSAICWSCYVPLGNEASNGSFSNSAFVHSHPLLE